MRRPTPIWLLAIALICYCQFTSAQPTCFGINLYHAISYGLPNSEIPEKGKPKIIYVKVGANGSGQSWKDASGDLQQSIQAAPAGAQIWVAGGTYYPTSNNDRYRAFELKDAVSIYGGFSGRENTIDQRDLIANPTILSGEIGTSSQEDNSYTIVYAENISKQTIIDGFVISGGFANGTTQYVSTKNNGAAWFNYNSSPIIRNCAFKRNVAREGGAIYNYASKGRSISPKIISCRFIGNQADLDGGAIFNNSDFGSCMPEIENSHFEDNLATYGAGIMNQARGGITRVSISQCMFVNNKSLVKGGAIYNNNIHFGKSMVFTKDCTYEDNLASFGSDISASLSYVSRD